VSAPTATGWADNRLMRATDQLEAVLLETPDDHPARAILKKALGLVEDADIAFEEEKA